MESECKIKSNTEHRFNRKFTGTCWKGAMKACYFNVTIMSRCGHRVLFRIKLTAEENIRCTNIRTDRCQPYAWVMIIKSIYEGGGNMLTYKAKIGATCAHDAFVELAPGGTTSCANCTCCTCCY